MEIRFKKIHPEAKINVPYHEGDVGYDVYAIESKIIWFGFPALVGIGMAIEMPKDIYCTVETRGGHGVKGNLRLHRGIIDNGYRGELAVKVYNHGILPYHVKKGEKIAQLVFHKICTFPLRKAGKLSTTKRGINGFHSTGK